MKTFEDLEALTIPQLTAIATDLGVKVPQKAKKAEIVQLVYDVQQPDPTEEEENKDPEPEENKPTNVDKEFEDKLGSIIDHFEGTHANEVDEVDGVIVYAIVDELTDEELARGTFLELEAQVAPKPNEPVDLDKEAGVGENELPGEPDIEETVLDTPDLKDEDDLAAIERELKPLRQYGLKYKIDGSVIRFQLGSKVATTTLNQPTHRVIRTAEQLCNK